MVRVDVCSLDLDQAGDVVGGRPKSFAQELRNNLDKLATQTRESLEFLHSA